jgi:cell division protein FtsX
MNRTAGRSDFDMPVRMRLVEGDLDTLEEGQEKLVAALDGIRKVLIGVLVSVTTASVLLAVNVLVLRGG